ncbi:unnamed protein product [Leptosia nina]|uniref:Peptidase S1 domain-containing protein n=1 Tax=Leptosia nina TaxID=320188 RepID=A0AAV1J472_9NEOP
MWGLLITIAVSTITASSSETRIIGGEQTARNSRPYQVALYLRVGTTGRVGFCGGSLIDPQWVITAAHCCFHDDVLVDNVQAILGAYSLYDRYENGRRILNVEEIIVHPEWNSTFFLNDLALMRLSNLVQMTETINSIRLPYLNISENNFAGAASIASGWGIAAPQVTFVSPTLRQKTMSVITDALCNATMFDQLPPNMVCGISTYSGTCKGDNGGPLTIVYHVTGEEILIGVATIIDATGCNDQLPSMFTRVQRHLSWINNTTGIELL